PRPKPGWRPAPGTKSRSPRFDASSAIPPREYQRTRQLHDGSGIMLPRIPPWTSFAALGPDAAEWPDRPPADRRPPPARPGPFSLDRSILLRCQMAASTAAEKVLHLDYTCLRVVKSCHVLTCRLTHFLAHNSRIMYPWYNTG